MPLSSPLLIETERVTWDNFNGFLHLLRGCWKSSSILWMKSHNFPVLSGVILNCWTQESEDAVSRFCRDRNFSELLVRIENPGQRWTRLRGGYTVPLGSIPSLVRALASEGMITILLEPASPYSDLYSLTSVCEVDAGTVDIEVVGPGFDASDVLRADIAPHERFEIRFDNGSNTASDRQKVSITRTHLIDRDGYRAAVRRRLAKVGARLRNPSFPDEFLNASISAPALDDLAHEGTRYLQESGQTTLLNHPDMYEPLPTGFLNAFLKELLRLSRTVAASRISWRTFSLAASFLSGGREVIWDFFPLGDHDVRTLYSLIVHKPVP